MRQSNRFNLLEAFWGFIKFGTNSRFLGLTILYTTSSIVLYLLLLATKLLIHVQQNNVPGTYIFYSALAGLAIATGTPIFKILTKLNEYSLKVMLIFAGYINLLLAFVPSNLDKIFSIKKNN